MSVFPPGLHGMASAIPVPPAGGTGGTWFHRLPPSRAAHFTAAAQVHISGRLHWHAAARWVKQ